MENFGKTDCQNYTETAVIENGGNTDCQNYNIETDIMENFGKTDCQNYTETAVIENGGNTDCQNYSETAVMENFGNTDCQNYSETDIMENFGNTNCQNYIEPVTANTETTGYEDNFSENVVMMEQTFMETPRFLENTSGSCFNEIESGLTVKSLSEARKESGVTSYKEILKKAWFSKRTGPNSKGNDEDADIWENIDKTGSCESKEYWELAVPSPLEQTDLLLEQEYRIHDLQARKEAIFDAVFQKLTAHPRFAEDFRSYLLAINSRDRKWNTTPGDFMVQNLPMDAMPDIFINNGQFEGLDFLALREVLNYSLPVMNIYYRALLSANVDQGTFLRQTAASGTLSQPIMDHYNQAFRGQPNKELLVRSFDPMDHGFVSPWAATWEDEVKFSTTMLKIGSLIKSDIKLSTLYYLLIAFTPSNDSVYKNDRAIIKIQNEIFFLIFRYLKSKHGEKGCETFNQLNSLLGELHECRDITVNRRIAL